jgi:hypothetical protein
MTKQDTTGLSLLEKCMADREDLRKRVWELETWIKKAATELVKLDKAVVAGIKHHSALMTLSNAAARRLVSEAKTMGITEE